ncbi:ribbon-helix-helix domain-containing protein [Aureimonas leprariae]|uniref:CopG family transcriptional regulator n=1 Tax=Plantimonas leprariae TaxID=2615207 RepID=A0A7V7PM89_9HYPH|nr:hypothetical protein [Aureimonas leprariae]KAB0678004.1 hypothetical protein F6X38_16370 [Aureimonas leprariae]
MSDTKTVTVDLGEEAQTLEERMASGKYASPSEVVQEALQALDREDAMLEELVEENLEEVDLPTAADAPKPAA